MAPPIIRKRSGTLLYIYEIPKVEIIKKAKTINKVKYVFVRTDEPDAKRGPIWVESKTCDIANKREVKSKKNTTKNFSFVIVFTEKSAIPKRERIDKNLKKYKRREIYISSDNMAVENKKRGGKRRKASQFIQNKNNSKKKISSDCIFLKAIYMYRLKEKETTEKKREAEETAIGAYGKCKKGLPSLANKYGGKRIYASFKRE